RVPAVRRVVLQADQAEEVAAFFRDKLDLQEEDKSAGGVGLSDGYIHLSVVRQGPTSKRGIQAVGLQVDDWAAVAERFRAMGQTLPTPASPDGEVEVRDPEGNLILLSLTGWDRAQEPAIPAAATSRA